MADFTELIEITADDDSWRSSLQAIEREYDNFLSRLNQKSDTVVGVTLEDTQVKQELASIASEVRELADLFSSAFGAGAENAASSADAVKSSISNVTEAAIASERAQIEATASASKERIALYEKEAEARSRATSGRRPTGAASSIGSELDHLRSRRPTSSGEDDNFLSGFAGGVAGLAEFYGELMLVQAAFEAISAIAKAPFEAIGDGIKVMAQWEEKSSELKANLLDSGIFSKDPADNLKLAGVAADALYQKLLTLSTQLNVQPDRLQAALEMFTSRGGGNLTHGLSESADVAGYVTAALQSQNPLIQQRMVATQIQKLIAGTLKDSDKLPSAFGLSAEALNRMAVEARSSHDLLQQIEQAAPGLTNRFSESDNRLSSLIQKLTLMREQLEGTLAAPLFAVLVSAAQQLSDWIARNRGDLQTLLSELGGMVGGIAGEFVQLGKTIGESLGGPLSHAIKLLGAALTMVQQITAGYDIAINAPAALKGDDHARSAIHGDVESIKDSQEQQRRLNESLDDTPQQARDAQLKRARERADSEHSGDRFGADQYYSQQYDAIQDSYQQRVDPKGYLDSKVNSAVGAYQPKPIPPTADSISSQVSKLREQYQTTIKDITSAGTEFRKQVDQDVKAGIATLQQATAEKATSFDNQAKEVEAAGRKYTAALRGIHGTGSGDSRTSLADAIGANDRKAYDDATNGKRADTETIAHLNQQLEEAKEKTNSALAAGVSRQSFSVAEQREREGVISPEQLERSRSASQDQADSVELEVLRRQLAAVHGEDSDSVKRRAELQGQIDLHQQQQSFHRSDYSRNSGDDSFNVQQRQESMRVAADQARVQQLEAKQRQNEVEGDQPDDLRSDKNDVLNARLVSNNDQIKQLSDALDHLTDAIKSAPENAANPAAALAASPKIQEMQLKIANLAVDNATIRDLKTQNMSRAGFGNKSADDLFGKVDSDTGAHFDNWTHSAQSLQKATENIGAGIQNVESGYQQSGVGGAVGAGISTIGNMIPGVGGAVLGTIGSITSLLSNLFTQAAQNIGKEVAKAVDEVMEKYSTGQLSLNDTIAAVQQQINSLVAQESGQKGGQSVLDKELPGLQQELDSLKYQQQQEKWNFQDATVESSSTNSVTDQWLTDWININKQVYQYQQAVGSAGDAQIAQYLNQQMQQQQVQLQTQYNQGQQQAINDALQLNTLLQQRNNYEDQYRQQQFQILSADSLQRRGNPAEESARKLSMAKSQYDQQTQQMDYEIAQYQQKVGYEQQIFNLASDTATLQQQSLVAQNFQLQQQMAQYQAIVQLLAETAGATYANGSWNIPGITTSSGGGFTIPGTSSTSTDNSVNTTGQTINIALTVPPGMSTSDLANEIASEIEYASRTRS